MARPRNPNREDAKKKWLESDGKISTKQLAEEAGVGESRVRKWKSEDDWKETLEKQRAKRRPGGQPGNKNATGAGAPYENKNAETHGAYSKTHLADLPEEQRNYIESITLDMTENMLRELRLLMTKEVDLQMKIKAVEQETDENSLIDRVMEMQAPDKEDKTNPDEKSDKKTVMKYVFKSSSFERAMKLEAELNKVHGRIIKLLDTIKSYELDSRRAELDERKYRLAKQRATGEFIIDPNTGEIDDMIDAESDSSDMDGPPE